MSDVVVAPETRDLETLARQLERWLASRVDGAHDVAVTSLDYPRGAGQSHETVLFDAAWTAGGVREQRGCVVRIKPTSHLVFPDDLFAQQYEIMTALHADGRVRVAEPYWFEEDAGLLGAPFFVMERMTGRVPVSIPPYARFGWVAEATADERRRLWASGVRQLAAVQSLPLDGLDFLAYGPPGADRGFAQEIAKYRRFIDWAADDRFRPVLTAGLDRLEASAPANRSEGLVWGDARLGNMMFGADFEVVAVMDWEQPSLGGALHDLGWWLVITEGMHRATADGAWLSGMGTRAETIALWEAETGLSADGIEWYEEFAHLKMSCCSLSTASLGRYPEPDPAAMARRLKVAEAA